MSENILVKFLFKNNLFSCFVVANCYLFFVQKCCFFFSPSHWKCLRRCKLSIILLEIFSLSKWAFLFYSSLWIDCVDEKASFLCTNNPQALAGTDRVNFVAWKYIYSLEMMKGRILFVYTFWKYNWSTRNAFTRMCVCVCKCCW